METIKDTCYKGTRILLGDEKRRLISQMIKLLTSLDFVEISIPIIQFQEIFKGKVGEENNNQMFNFQDKGNRDLCLAPEYTAVIQKLAQTRFRLEKDFKLFYVGECFRGEKPQAGRYRQFTQLGVEILNPTKDYVDFLAKTAMNLISFAGFEFWINNKVQNKTEFDKQFNINLNVTRGLDYYKDGKGFEITWDALGSSKQICGGGEYDGGIGFAIGIDRLIK
jgi:histidyl-tRNA synthetase